MKLLLDIDEFDNCEFDTLLSTIKEKNALKEMIENVKNDSYEELEITVEIDRKKCWGYWCSKHLSKELLLKLLYEMEKENEKYLEDLLKSCGLKEIK